MPNYAKQSQIKMIDFEKIKHQPDNGCRFIQPIDFKYEAAAMRNLNGNAFKVWRYFLRWYGGKKLLYYSPAALSKEIGLGENGGTTARNELVRKGYLIPVEGKENCYYFTPVLPVDYENLKNKRDFNDDENDF